MNIESRFIVLGVVVLIVLSGLGWIPGTLDDQIQLLVETLIPWSPLFLILYFAGTAFLQGVANGIGNFFKSIWNAVIGLLWIVSFAAFFFPLAVVDTFMFGDLSHWMWINQSGAMILVAVTAFAFYMMGGVTAAFWRRYFGFMVLWGMAVVVVGVLEHYFMDSHKVVFRVAEAGKIYSVPTQTVYVEKSKEETLLHISTFGRVGVGNKFYPPMGDPADWIPDPHGGWRAPRGQVRLLVYFSRNARPIGVPIKPKQEGVRKLAGIDTGEQVGGYYYSGTATIPADVSGWVMLDFEGITPDSGFVRTTIRISPEKSLPGRVIGLEWYAFLLVFVLVSALYWSVPSAARYFLSATRQTPVGVVKDTPKLGWLVFMMLVVYVATAVAVVQETPAVKSLLERIPKKLEPLVPKPEKRRNYTCNFNQGVMGEFSGILATESLRGHGCEEFRFLQGPVGATLVFDRNPCGTEMAVFEVVFGTLEVESVGKKWQVSGKKVVYNHPMKLRKVLPVTAMQSVTKLTCGS